jgi:ribosomal-protein-alanine N-acetyltransferase
MTGGICPRVMRTMTERDIPEIMEIEKRSFISPWTRGMFTQTLESPVAYNFVMIGKQKILGYVIFYQAGLEMHIMNIAVHPDHRRQGIGSDMMQRILETSRTNSVGECFLEVRETNFPAQGLYEKLGFRSIGRRKGYYSETDEDAIVMVLSMPGPAPEHSFE